MQPSDCPRPEELSEYLLGNVQEQRANQLEQHILGCAACEATTDNLHHVSDTLLETIRAAENARSSQSKDGNFQTPGTRSVSGAETNLGSVPSGEQQRPQAQFSFLAPSQAADEIGRLGSYRVLKVLGTGGMGVVFEAQDLQLNRHVALKAMRFGFEDPILRQRFLREAKATASLKHDHVVTIFQVGEDRGVPFLAMELLEGETLNERIRRDRKLPLRELLRIGREIAEGLAAAHARGLIHRNIKPANIWLEGERGRVKILDFGLARITNTDVHLTQSGNIMGTPAFMAPEQARSQTVDFRCDLFSLGSVLYYLAAGELAIKGDEPIGMLTALTSFEPRPPIEIDPTIPPVLSRLIVQLLKKRPEVRPSSALEVADQLAALEQDLPINLRSQSRSAL